AVRGGYKLSGPITWASNLHPDSLLVTAARTESGETLIVALPLDTPGVAVGDRPELLALESTASSSVELTDVRITAAQVLSKNSRAFLTAVRPTMLLLQSSMCLGLAKTSAEQAQLELTGVNSVFADDVARIVGELVALEKTLTAMAASTGHEDNPTT